MNLLQVGYQTNSVEFTNKFHKKSRTLTNSVHARTIRAAATVERPMPILVLNRKMYLGAWTHGICLGVSSEYILLVFFLKKILYTHAYTFIPLQLVVWTGGGLQKKLVTVLECTCMFTYI
jgi:hypothetical protein